MTCELEPLSPKTTDSKLQNSVIGGTYQEQEEDSSNEISGYLGSLLKKVKKVYQVEIYYETLCPDSKYFVVKQFLPFFTHFSQNPVYAIPSGGGEPTEKDRIVVNPVFVPYGKAETTIKVNFRIFCPQCYQC